MRILCFGDSNTWGFKPDGTGRFEKRWPILLQQSFPEATIIEEGLNGRTFNIDEVGRDGINGFPYFVPCLDTHDPIDVVVLALGTNDLKSFFKKSADDIFSDAQLYLHQIKHRPQVGGVKRKCIIIGPVMPSTEMQWPEFMGEEIRKKVDDLYKLFATAEFPVIDARDLQLGQDGLHYTHLTHVKLAERILSQLKPKHS